MITLLLAVISTLLPSDTTRIVELDEATVFSQPKEYGALRQQTSSITQVSASTLQQHHVGTVKELGAIVPNFFMPNYGSRQTSAIYIRGIGSRVNTPAVGLYVDNIPYYDKSAFDSPFYDIERLEVLRGPQSTIYGRNTMAGVVRVHTRSPFSYQGTDIRLGASSGNWGRDVAVTRYQRVGNRMALSYGGYYTGAQGFYRHDITDRYMDGENAGGARVRALYRNDHGFRLDANLALDYTKGGAYPYYYAGVVSGTEIYPDEVGRITANLDGSYRRAMLNAGANLEWTRPAWKLNAITGVQHLSDRMFMDQDFLQADIYSLEQRQRITTFSEEITLNHTPVRWWHGLTGASVFCQDNHTEAPVSFRKDGVEWLNTKIRNASIQGDLLRFDAVFKLPTMSAAVFHQSTFSVGSLHVTPGFRLDYQRDRFNYTGSYALTYVATHNGQALPPLALDNTLRGVGHHGQWRFLPKMSLRYDVEAGNVYASVSYGYRSGGYNIQNVSDLMQAQLTYDMIGDILQQPWAESLSSIAVWGMKAAAGKGAGDVPKACLYRPEYAWNYEVGSHLNFWENRLKIDVAAFWSDIRDLQLSRMTNNGLGRFTTNAGRSRSLGGEASVRLTPVAGLELNLSYGYTHATFRRYYNVSKSGGVDAVVNCRGKRVPFIPEHTFLMDAAYILPVGSNHFLVGCDVSGVGRIYWNENNSASQHPYALLGARIGYVLPSVELTLWGKNLTNATYDTFYFESMQRGYAQQGHPAQAGISLKIKLR